MRRSTRVCVTSAALYELECSCSYYKSPKKVESRKNDTKRAKKPKSQKGRWLLVGWCGFSQGLALLVGRLLSGATGACYSVSVRACGAARVEP